MKKIFTLTVITVLFTAATVYAQTNFGVRAGVTSATWKGDAASSLTDLTEYSNGYISTSGRTGFFAGGYAEIPFSEVFSVEPGIYYSQKGHTLKGNLRVDKLDFLGASARAQVQSHYIDIPVLIKANVAGGLQVFGGPQVSYLAASNLNVQAGALGFNIVNRNMNITDQFNRIDMSLVGGAGYRFENGISINASYDHGLSRLDKNGYLNSYNRSVKVGIGFNF